MTPPVPSTLHESRTVRTLGLNGRGEASSETPSTSGAAGVDRTGGNQSARLREAIDHLLKDFAPSELYAVLFVARRLAKGRKQYGVLNPLDGRDWDLMAAEELADKLVYSAAKEMSTSLDITEVP